MAGAYLEILQGDDYTFSTNVALDGVAQNIAGASLWFLAKGDPDNDGDDVAVINASTGSGQLAISGANNNVITMTLNGNFTANLAQANVLHWALKCQTALGFNYTLDRGRAAVCAPVISP